MLPISKETKSFLIILDSNLKFQSLALVLNLLETQGSGRRILIYYVYDSVDDKLEYRELVNSVYQSFGFSNQIEYLEIKAISNEEADELTKAFSIIEGNPITKTSFLRLFFTNWLPEDIERVIYLDIDVYVNSNLEELFNMTFSTPICAGLNVPSTLAIGDHLVGHESPYFNAGVLLVDVIKWRAMDLEDTFIEIGSRQAYPFLDQDVLNIVFKNKWTRLARQFNYLHLFGSNEHDADYAEFPRIIHFAGSKPWKQSPLTQYVAQYRQNFNRIRKLHGLTTDEINWRDV
jgi:lipopolysaccharide biosynthesis glycosyltransferase